MLLLLWFTVGLDTLESEADLLRDSAPSETELRRPVDFFLPLALLPPLADTDEAQGGSNVFPIRPSISSRYPCRRSEEIIYIILNALYGNIEIGIEGHFSPSSSKKIADRS